MDEDWDNLIILDACRYDLYESTVDTGGNLEKRTSLGSSTPEFLEKNFAGTTHHDSVYVTANPQIHVSDVDFSKRFHDVIHVWQDSWDDEHQTVLPKDMAEATLKTNKQYPDKRIISHFVQPHYPFVGEYGKQIGSQSGMEASLRGATGEVAERDNPTAWQRAKSGEISTELVEKAYRENLELALPYVSDLIEAFDGRTVVTSDHGNHLGEQPVPLLSPQYGHPQGVYTDALRIVPWDTIEGRKRKTIAAEPPKKNQKGPSADVQDRLADLGYV